MASSPRFPFPAARSMGAATSASSGPQRQALDDLIRRELRISDPSDPVQVAKALRERYQGDRRAEAIDQEALGLPYLQTGLSAPALVAAPTSSGAEMAQAKDDIERDLAALTQSSLLKDTMAELLGWGDAIRGLVGEGAASAPFALDTRQRDKVFGIRRQLGDYARIARLIGALTPHVNALFRSLAKSLDEAANVLLVMMGDALANAGYTAGKFLLQVPFSELQVRREAVLAALRNLTGQTGASYLQQTSNEWKYGLYAYRQIYAELDRRGDGDLRVMLLEGELARMMDALIERAAHGSVDGLRALGATAEVDVDRFRRLARVGAAMMGRPDVEVSPPLVAFNDALSLFVDSFESSGGARLLRIARPPILFYGLYGTRFASSGEARLMELVRARGQIADLADCVMECCGPDAGRQITAQALIDKVVYDLDRAIDLYSMAERDWDDAEVRAAAYAFVALEVAARLKGRSRLPDAIRAAISGVGYALLGSPSSDERADLTGDWSLEDVIRKFDPTPEGREAEVHDSGRSEVLFWWWLWGKVKSDKELKKGSKDTSDEGLEGKFAEAIAAGELTGELASGAVIVGELEVQQERDRDGLRRVVEAMAMQCGDLLKTTFNELSDVIERALGVFKAAKIDAPAGTQIASPLEYGLAQVTGAIQGRVADRSRSPRRAE